MKFFRDYVGEWLCKPWAKALVLTVFVTYIGVACWGVTGLQEGLEKKRLSRFDSYSVDYYNIEAKYFMEYPFRVNVSINPSWSQQRNGQSLVMILITMW